VIMKNNIIMWQESNEIKRVLLQYALNHATQPIRDAMHFFEWEGDCLTCGPETLKNGKEHWRNLYFYLSGWGDAEFAHSHTEIKHQPVAIPTARANNQT
jgi:hypothetical protein